MQASGSIDNIHGSGPSSMILNTEGSRGHRVMDEIGKDTLGVE